MQNRKRHRCTEQNFGLCGRRWGWDVLRASKHVYYLGWNRSPAQVECMRQVLGPGALGRPRGIGWRGKWEGVSGWGIHVNPWLIHVNVWQKPLQYCKVISLQLKKKKPMGKVYKGDEFSPTFLNKLKKKKKRLQIPIQRVPFSPCSQGWDPTFLMARKT